MKKVREFLEANGYEFDMHRMGDEDFNVPYIIVSFWSDQIGNSREQREAFVRFIKNRRSLTIEHNFTSLRWDFRVYTAADHAAISEYLARKQAESDAYWEAEHARRLAAGEPIKGVKIA